MLKYRDKLFKIIVTTILSLLKKIKLYQVKNKIAHRNWKFIRNKISLIEEIQCENIWLSHLWIFWVENWATIYQDSWRKWKSHSKSSVWFNANINIQFALIVIIYLETFSLFIFNFKKKKKIIILFETFDLNFI